MGPITGMHLHPLSGCHFFRGQSPRTQPNITSQAQSVVLTPPSSSYSRLSIYLPCSSTFAGGRMSSPRPRDKKQEEALIFESPKRHSPLFRFHYSALLASCALACLLFVFAMTVWHATLTSHTSALPEEVEGTAADVTQIPPTSRWFPSPFFAPSRFCPSSSLS